MKIIPCPPILYTDIILRCHSIHRNWHWVEVYDTGRVGWLLLDYSIICELDWTQKHSVEIFENSVDESLEENKIRNRKLYKNELGSYWQIVVFLGKKSWYMNWSKIRGRYFGWREFYWKERWIIIIWVLFIIGWAFMSLCWLMIEIIMIT